MGQNRHRTHCFFFFFQHKNPQTHSRRVSSVVLPGRAVAIMHAATVPSARLVSAHAIAPASRSSTGFAFFHGGRVRRGTRVSLLCRYASISMKTWAIDHFRCAGPACASHLCLCRCPCVSLVALLLCLNLKRRQLEQADPVALGWFHMRVSFLLVPLTLRLTRRRVLRVSSGGMAGRGTQVALL